MIVIISTQRKVDKCVHNKIQKSQRNDDQAVAEAAKESLLYRMHEWNCVENKVSERKCRVAAAIRNSAHLVLDAFRDLMKFPKIDM